MNKPLEREYKKLWDSMVVNKNPSWEIQRIHQNLEHYKEAQELSGVPWQVIAVIHVMEAAGNMTRQILNGEKWDQETVLVPKGEGPFNSWAESTKRAFELSKPMKNWSIPNTLYFLEGHNGWGYRRIHSDVLSPYLWSGSNHYKKGKYVADGKWDKNYVSKQIGAAVILKALGYKGKE